MKKFLIIIVAGFTFILAFLVIAYQRSQRPKLPVPETVGDGTYDFSFRTQMRDEARARGEVVQEGPLDQSTDQAEAARLTRECNNYVRMLPHIGIDRDLDHGRVFVRPSVTDFPSHSSDLSEADVQYAARMFVCDRPDIKEYALINKETGRKIGEFGRGALILTRPTRSR